MSELVYRTAKLSPYAKRPRAIAGFTNSIVFEASDPARETDISLLLVLEVLTNVKQAQEVADIIIETAAEQWDKPQESKSALETFEQTIKLINTRLAEYTDQGNASWIGRLSAVFALLDAEQLHLTQTGSAEAFLLRGESFSHITSGLTGRGPHRPISTFGNIASGKLKVGDKLLLATPALFHQLARAELKAIILDNSPNAAVQKLSDILHSSDAADRTAAILTEASTPQLLAMQTLPTEPDEVLVGSPENVLVAAKLATTPVVQTATSNSKLLAEKVAHLHRTVILPRSKTAALASAKIARKAFRHRLALPVTGLLAIIVIGASLASMYNHNQAKTVADLLGRFDAIVAKESQARQSLTQSNQLKAQELALQGMNDLNALKNDKQVGKLEKALQQRSRPEGTAASLAELSSQLQELQQLADGVSNPQTTLITSFKDIDSTQLVLSKLVGSSLVTVNSTSTPSIYVVDITTKALRTVSSPSLPALGKVLSISLNNNGDGIYLLTSQPAVWLYKPGDNSLFKLTVVGGDWPKAKAVGAYGGNIYLLSDDGTQIFRHVPQVNGYAPKASYLTAPNSLTGGLTMAVDGSIYISSSSTIQRFISGKPQASSANLPAQLQKLSTLESTQSGTILAGYDQSSRRITIINIEGTPTVNRQFALANTAFIAAATDPKARQIYAITDKKNLVRFSY